MVLFLLLCAPAPTIGLAYAHYRYRMKLSRKERKADEQSLPQYSGPSPALTPRAGDIVCFNAVRTPFVHLYSGSGIQRAILLNRPKPTADKYHNFLTIAHNKLYVALIVSNPTIIRPESPNASFIPMETRIIHDRVAFQRRVGTIPELSIRDHVNRCYGYDDIVRIHDDGHGIAKEDTQTYVTTDIITPISLDLMSLDTQLRTTMPRVTEESYGLLCRMLRDNKTTIYVLRRRDGSEQ
ncbi:MAG: hypothetical protein MMC23_007470 [Stictis urceolatum]|nr:hypothetical protein [Stictis urceolata]